MDAQRPRTEATGTDGRDAVDAPVIRALNAIILRAAVGFAVVAALATAPILLPLPAVAHEAFHLAVPIGGALYAATTFLILSRRPTIEGDPWARAADVDRPLTRFARITEAVMVIGWLGAAVAVLVDHHLTSVVAAVGTLLIDVPIMGAVWFFATWAWTRACRHWLARSEAEATERLRAYWRDVANR